MLKNQERSTDKAARFRSAYGLRHRLCAWVLWVAMLIGVMPAAALPALAAGATGTVMDVATFEELRSAVEGRVSRRFRLTADVTVTETIYVPSGTDVELDLADHRLSAVTRLTGRMFVVNGGSMTLLGGANSGTGVVEDGTGLPEGVVGGVMTLLGGANGGAGVVEGGSGGFVELTGAAELYISGTVRFLQIRAARGAVAYAGSRCSITLDGAEGVGVCVDGCEADQGGAFYLDTRAKLVNVGRFEARGCTAEDGGVLYCAPDAELTMTGTVDTSGAQRGSVVLQENRALRGGAFYFRDAEAHLMNIYAYENEARQGGVIFAAGGGAGIHIRSGCFVGNFASGSAVTSTAANMGISGGVIYKEAGVPMTLSAPENYADVPESGSDGLPKEVRDSDCQRLYMAYNGSEGHGGAIYIARETDGIESLEFLGTVVAKDNAHVIRDVSSGVSDEQSDAEGTAASEAGSSGTSTGGLRGLIKSGMQALRDFFTGKGTEEEQQVADQAGEGAIEWSKEDIYVAGLNGWYLDASQVAALGLCLTVQQDCAKTVFRNKSDAAKFIISERSYQYLLKVVTGAYAGNNVQYLGIRYRDPNGIEHTQFVYPHEGALNESYRLIGGTQLVNDRLSTLKDLTGYTVEGAADLSTDRVDGLQAHSSDYYLFTARHEMDALLGVDVFMRYPTGENAKTNGWNCSGMFVYRVDELWGYNIAGCISDDKYVSFSGDIVGYLVQPRMDDGQTARPGDQVSIDFPLGRSDTIIRIGRDPIYRMEIPEKPIQYSSQSTDFIFKIDFADVNEGGIRALAANVGDGHCLKDVVEALTLAVTYEDVYGVYQTLNIPVISSALTWAVENGLLDKKLPIAGIAQQGESVLFKGTLPEFSRIISTSLTFGSAAAEAAGLELASPTAAQTARIKELSDAHCHISAMQIYDGSAKIVNNSVGAMLDLTVDSEAEPLYFFCDQDFEGQRLNSGVTSMDRLLVEYPAGSGVPLHPKQDAYNFAVVITTSGIPQAATTEEITLDLCYSTTTGEERTYSGISLKDVAGEFMGYWPGRGGKDVVYQESMSAGSDLIFMLNIENVSKFISATFSMSSKSSDDWQMERMCILDGTTLPRRYAVWQDTSYSDRCYYRPYTLDYSSVLACYPYETFEKMAKAAGENTLVSVGTNGGSMSGVDPVVATDEITGAPILLSEVGKISGKQVISATEIESRIEAAPPETLEPTETQEPESDDVDLTTAMGESEDGDLTFEEATGAESGGEIGEDTLTTALYLSARSNTKTIYFENTKSVVEKTVRYDWDQLRSYMTEEDTHLDLQFDQRQNQYQVAVKVAGSGQSTASDGDTGSNNLYYFMLIFENGCSGYVLANQQLEGDGFRPDMVEIFTIYTNRDYGNVTGVSIIPEVSSENSSETFFDKLKVENIQITKMDMSESLSQTWEISDVGWIGMDYMDRGAENTMKGRPGRSEGEVARYFEVTKRGYSVNLMMTLPTGSYERSDADRNKSASNPNHPQLVGAMMATIYYYNNEGSLKKMSFDVVEAIYNYAEQNPVSYEQTFVDKDGKTETRCKSDEEFMFRAGHTDRFMVTVPDMQQLVRITLATSAENTTIWRFGQMKVYQVEEAGDLQLTMNDEYRRSSTLKLLCTSTADSYEVQMIGKSDPAAATGTEQERTVYFTDHKLSVSLTGEWSTTITRKPVSKNDALNIYVYMTDPVSADCEMQSTVLWESSENDETYSKPISDMTRSADGRMFYALGASFAGLSKVYKLALRANAREMVSQGVSHAVIQHVRSGVTINSYYLSFGNRSADPMTAPNGLVANVTSDQPGGDQTLGTQTVELFFSPDMEPIELNPEVDDILVSLRYRTTSDVEKAAADRSEKPEEAAGLYYHTAYVYLTDIKDENGEQKYTRVTPGMSATLEYSMGYISEIIGVNVVSVGNAPAEVLGAYVRTADDSWYSFSERWTLTETPHLLTRTEDNVMPVQMTFVTGSNAQIIGSGGENCGMDAPIEMKVHFVDQFSGLQKVLKIPDIRTYLIDGGFTSEQGSNTATIRFMISGAGEIRSVTLRPHSDEDTETTVGYDYGADAAGPEEEETVPSQYSAKWGLRSLTCETVYDGIRKVYDQKVLGTDETGTIIEESSPVTVNLSEILVRVSGKITDDGFVGTMVNAGPNASAAISMQAGSVLTLKPTVVGSLEGYGFTVRVLRKLTKESAGIEVTDCGSLTDGGTIFVLTPKRESETSYYEVIVASEEMPEKQCSIEIEVYADPELQKIEIPQQQEPQPTTTPATEPTDTEQEKKSEDDGDDTPPNDGDQTGSGSEPGTEPAATEPAAAEPTTGDEPPAGE